jgi:hypothetical protein
VEKAPGRRTNIGRKAEVTDQRVAGAIRDATGLSVDIIRGSSPRSIQVDLPAGKFGRPSLTVTEPWAVKGVAFKFLRAVSAQNLALFGLVLLGGMVLVGETGYISVVRRRREFGVLRALGWRTSSIAWLVELEMLTLGLVVGVLAIALGLPIMLRLGLGTSAWELGAVVPLSVGIAALAGIIPALAAARGSVVAMIESTGRATITNRPLTSGVIGIAWRELRGPSPSNQFCAIERPRGVRLSMRRSGRLSWRTRALVIRPSCSIRASVR